MDKKRQEIYRKRLLERQIQLFDTVSKTEQDGRQADEEPAQDLADKASNSYTKEFLFKKSNDDRFILHLIDEALRRMEDGAYGVCVACGGEMQQKRLEAVPWARHCIECQEKQEQGLLQ
jgi:DnaK suppressor protein